MKAIILATTVFASAVMAQGGCSPLELIYARATTEPVGFGAAGKNLVDHLKKDLPGSDAYAVVYPASMDLNGGGCTGVKDLIKRLQTQSAKCPNQKFALGGHSQGGAVVTAAIPHIPKDIVSKIVAVTMFGSPPCSDVPQVSGHCKSFCNKGDTICDSKGAMGGGGPRVKCSGVKARTMADPAYVSLWDRPWAETVNDSEPMTKRQMGKGKAAGASAGGGGAGTNGCGEDERGHSAGGSGMSAHMAYNRDGYYTAAASCYITKMFKSAGGAAAAASAE